MLAKPRVVPVLLGSAWQEPQYRGRVVDVTRDLSAGGGKQLGGLGRYGVAASGMKVSAPVTAPLASESSANDLDVQRQLEELFTSKALDAPGSDGVYLVLLGPWTTSRLGEKVGGAEYLAYHNHFHGTAGVVRYIVVPYLHSLEQTTDAIRQALANTLINPEGDGWY